MPTTKRPKKPAKKKSAKKGTKKGAPAASSEAAAAKRATQRKRLIRHLADTSSTVDGVRKKLADLTGRGLSREEETLASDEIVKKVLRGGKRGRR